VNGRAELLKRTVLSHHDRGASSTAASHIDVLRINRPRELSAEPSAALVRKRADQLATVSDKHLQGRARVCARRLNSKSAVACVVCGSRDCDRIRRRRRFRRDSQTHAARHATGTSTQSRKCPCRDLIGGDVKSASTSPAGIVRQPFCGLAFR